jgi:hypothetical protein
MQQGHNKQYLTPFPYTAHWQFSCNNERQKATVACGVTRDHYEVGQVLHSVLLLETDFACTHSSPCK